MSSKITIFAEDMTDEMQSMASESAVAAFQKTYTMGNVYAQSPQLFGRTLTTRMERAGIAWLGRALGRL